MTANEGRTDLVVCSLEPWDATWRRNQFLVAGLLQADSALRVLFVEPPEDPAYLVKLGMAPKLGQGLRVIDDVPGVAAGRLWAIQPTKWLPRSVNPWSDNRLAGKAIKAAVRLGFDRPVLWINNPTNVALLERTGWPTLYDITDDWLLADRSTKEQKSLADAEASLMRLATAVTVCSPGLLQSKSTIRPVTLIPNGVDVSRYRTPQPRPGDLPDGKIALYVGTVHSDRIDEELCLRTAERLTRDRIGSLVLVGSFQLGAQAGARITEAGGVILGARPNGQIPGYLQNADVLIVPHLVNRFTDSLDPIKLYEYRAVAKRIVATPVAGFREQRYPEIEAVEREAFPEAVAAAITAHRKPMDDVVPADVPDWSVRVRAMAEIIAKVAGGRPRDQHE